MYLPPVFIFTIGLAGGSFLGLCIFRLPLGKSIIYPGSSCDTCGRRLGLLQLIPVLGFICFRGRCPSCRAPVFWWYPVLEVLTAFLYLGLWCRLGFSWLFIKYISLVSLLLVIAGVDLQTYTIADELVFWGLGLGLIFLPLGDIYWLDAVCSAVVGSGLLLLLAVISHGGIGGGDVKLSFVLGLFLGWQQMLVTFFIAVLAGAMAGALLLVSGHRNWGDALPFAPFLALGVLVALWRGPEIVSWYFSILLKASFI